MERGSIRLKNQTAAVICYPICNSIIFPQTPIQFQNLVSSSRFLKQTKVEAAVCPPTFIHLRFTDYPSPPH